MKVCALVVLLAVTGYASPIPDDEDIGVAELIVNGLPEGEPLDIDHIVDIRLKHHEDGVLVASTDLLYGLSSDGIAAAAAAAASEAAVALPEIPTPEVVEVPSAVELPEVPTPETVDAGVPAAVALPEIPTPEVVDSGVPSAIELPDVPTPEVIDIGVPAGVVLPEIPTPEVVDSAVPAAVVLPEIPTPVVVDGPAAAELPEVPAPEIVDTGVPTGVVLPEIPTPEIVDTETVAVADGETPLQSLNGEIYNDGQVSIALNMPEEASVLETLQAWFSLVINYIQDGVTATSQQIV